MAKQLSDLQYAAIALLAMPQRGGRTYPEVAAEVGVDERTLRRWRNDDDFNAELKRKIMNDTTDRLPEVMASIPDHIITDGNAAMFRTLLQAHGLLTEKHEVETKDSGSTDIASIRDKIAQYKDEDNEDGGQGADE
ncbi:phBC6A51 family helix-turn-helix protein [Salibacterium lacus]|uniref:PhBC6A51 family helix-turn-helix protein n=1 Tax=Salibacterium lacus TaxID=1898109 RepID=A0ABW5T186_9BACI